jgi:hypothetical protein
MATTTQQSAFSQTGFIAEDAKVAKGTKEMGSEGAADIQNP